MKFSRTTFSRRGVYTPTPSYVDLGICHCSS